MPSFAAQQCLFRAYDIRGSRQHFTTDFVYAVGNAFAHLYRAANHHLEDSDVKNSATTQNDSNPKNTDKNIVVIGYDMRFGSDTIAQTLANILTQHGLQVIQLGLITTPMMAFWTEQYQGHGIVVTASHSAKDILGIKWLVNHKSPSSREIQLLYQQLTDNYSQNQRNAQNTLLNTLDIPMPTNQNDLSGEQVIEVYIDAIAQVFWQIYPSCKQNSNNTSSSDKLDLVVVIDCLHGATSNIAERLFDRFCRQIIMLNDTADGNLPFGNPDPTEPYRLKQLQQSVLHHQADIGIAFDGDGDRLMVVDNSGSVVIADHLLYLLAQVALAERPTPLTDASLTSQILFDIKCSHHLPKLLSELGTVPVISKTGSSFMRQQMQHADSQILFAGELSGHFIFNDQRFIIYDDAMYAALRLLHWLAAADDINGNGKRSLTDITQCLPAMVNTADHYLPMPTIPESDCSFVEQLSRLCQYLRKLVDMTVEEDADDYLIHTDLPSFCRCSANRQRITLKQARDLLPVGTKLSCIDGVRLDFAHGFGVLRQSNTSHKLTARFAGDTLEDLKEIQAKFAALCHPFDKQLARQIATMPAE
ncbi:phosphohexomutase domain-containing protein [Psychrobacter aquaticus]|uniref:phosphomannomutase n=1 Tax=Psychrobacter aquaticus CMS 56 TaxID=1354303 RepID=U4TBL5_9GAMM|nr:phosphomannomutase [Psychrobacter aquaticus]ERL56094.1 Phosphomannomutase [Psychrobacter aquaticus CMS 56]